jgi:predicted outer membrane repeat protein
MDQERFDRISRLFGRATTRRAGIGSLAALAAGALAFGDAEVTDAKTGRKGPRPEGPRPEGPCGNGSKKANTCKKDKDCCTGYCKDGMCRGVPLGGTCSKTRKCRGTAVCKSGKCVRKNSPNPPPPLVCDVLDTGDPAANGIALAAAVVGAAADATLLIEPGQYNGDYVFSQNVTLQRCGTTGEVLLANVSAATRTIAISAGATTLTLIDISVIRNSATTDGGGIAAGIGTTLVLLGATAIRGGNQEDGGGILLDGATLNAGCDRTADATCTDTVIIGDADPTKGNAASDDGGGILAKGASVVTLRGNAQISGNTCVDDGGGIKLENTATLTVTDDASITSNSATQANESNGGGIRGSGGAIVLSGNARISYNTSADGGGGVWMGSGSLTISGSAIITQNTAAGSGGGLYSSDETITGATSTSVTGNTAGNCNNFFQNNSCTIA